MLGRSAKKPMPHQYKRRTYDEAMELAQERFRADAKTHLTDVEIEELRTKGTVAGGSFGDDWASELGGEPDKRIHYEYQVYLPSEECPYIERYYARILVSRDRDSDGVWIKWKPPVPEYHGPHFT
jgi:uncharacterized protein YciU (UPF0263 family)